jgi:hypothetical protein
MNKQSIQQVDERIAVLVKTIKRSSNELSKLYAKRKKMVTGKIKVPPPPGIKVSFAKTPPAFNDDIPEDLKLRRGRYGIGPC